METTILNRANVFNALDHLLAFNHYLKPYHNKGELGSGKLISNPFLTESQKSPSFNLYASTNGAYKYKDFATNDNGDIFDFVQKLNNCAFVEALEIINHDFNLGLSSKQSTSKFEIDLYPEMPIWALNYWKQFKVGEKSLQNLNVYCVKSLAIKSGKVFTTLSSEKNPVFAYQVTSDCFKIYQPLSTKHKFSWLGVKPSEYVFGLAQLPSDGSTLYITAGEKDALCVIAQNAPAIAFNSETYIPSESLMTHLNLRFKNIIVLYDLDKTGMEQSEKLCKQYGIKRALLPKKLSELGGKDIADFTKAGFTIIDPEIVIESFEKKTVSKPTVYLKSLLNLKEQIKFHKGRQISRPAPILCRLDQEIIFPNTINIIQGKAGVHKSRLAETICSAFIKKDLGTHSDLLDLKVNALKKPKVCYVDTERNLSDQFPYALQQINLKAGYSITDNPEDLDYISLLNVPRKDRFMALEEYLSHCREQLGNQHMVIVLDVITDCINDFNRADDSMQLIDLLNTTINSYNVTFLCLIHENPGSTDKARGHLGTELMNKASTVMQVSFEKSQNNAPTDILALTFLKKRNTRRYEPIYLKYSASAGGLGMADKEDLDDLHKDRKLKAHEDDVCKYIGSLQETRFMGADLIADLAEEFNVSTKIIRDRIKDIIDLEKPINHLGVATLYLKKHKEGKSVYYQLCA